VIERTVGSVTVLGPVRGLLAEAASVRQGLEAARPSVVGLAVSPDEITGLHDYFVVAATEPVVPLAPTEAAEIRGLSRYGEIAVPNPAVLSAMRWAETAGVPVESVDLDDDAYASLFAGTIGYFELVRRTLRERRVGRKPPQPKTADEFATAWADTIEHGAGSRRLRARRDAATVEAVGRLKARYPSVGVVVDRERFDGVVRGLETAGSLVRTPDDDGPGASR
jgi:hypothetical protein